MVRSFFLILVVMLSFGCSSSQTQTTKTRDELLNDTVQKALLEETGRCHNRGNDGYICDSGSPTSGNDIRGYEGYHEISRFKDDSGQTFAHVADSCQHYFCRVDESKPADQQVKTYGCCLAYQPDKVRNTLK